jgi:stress response protein SCP2
MSNKGLTFTYYHMAINLQKGQRENLSAPKFTIGLGWDTNSSIGMKGGLQDYVNKYE